MLLGDVRDRQAVFCARQARNPRGAWGWQGGLWQSWRRSDWCVLVESVGRGRPKSIQALMAPPHGAGSAEEANASVMARAIEQDPACLSLSRCTEIPQSSGIDQ